MNSTTLNDIIDLSLSIVVHELNAEDLIKCLNSLNTAISFAIKNNTIRNAKLYLQYNGEEKISPSRFDNILNQSFRFSSTYYLNCENIGYGGTNNTIIRKVVKKPARAKFLIVMNSDLEVDKKSINNAILNLKSRTRPGLVAPIIYNIAGAQQTYGNKRYPSLAVLTARLFPILLRFKLFSDLNKRYEYRNVEDESITSVQICSGSFLIGNHDFWYFTNGFDDKFFLYFEDFDLSIRGANLGFKHELDKSVIIRHKGGNTHQKPLHLKKLFITSAFHFYNTHGWRIWRV